MKKQISTCTMAVLWTFGAIGFIGIGSSARASRAGETSSGGTVNASKDYKFRDVKIDVQDGDRIVITGIRGVIRLEQTGGVSFGAPANDAGQDGVGANPSLQAQIPQDLPTTNANVKETAGPVSVTIKAHKLLSEKGLAQWATKFESLSLQTRRDGHVVYIETKGTQAAADWLEWTSANSPEINIEVSMNSARSLPVEVSLHDGTVDVRGWQAAVSASIVQGSIRTTNTLGDLHVQVQHGDVRINRHHGAVDVDSFQGKLIADHVEGDIHLDNFSGDSSLKNIAGNVFVRTHSGPTNVANSTGAIDFELGRGALNVAKFEGPVRGQTDRAAVVAKLEGESDVNIESAQGPVAVRLPASSGAAIRLQTETGTLNVPEEIRPSQTASSKFASGRMKGAGPRGSVTIKSKAASIRVRPDGAGASASAAPESEPAPSERASEPEPAAD